MRTYILTRGLVVGLSMIPAVDAGSGVALDPAFGSAVLISQPRGSVSSIAGTSTIFALGTIRFTVRGTNPCNSVNVDYGDGTVITHEIREVPASLSHEYIQAGTYLVRARGMGSCSGEATTKVSVLRVRPREGPQPVPPVPTDRFSEEQFRSMDRNQDNFISRGEWPYELAEFQRVDRNNDDRLSRSEFLDEAKADRDREAKDRADKDKKDRSVSITVSSREAWTDTGVDVHAGDELKIVAKGRIQFGPQKGDSAGPNGAPGNRRATANAPLPRLAIGALIARVGNSAPFNATEKGKRIREAESGRLYLGINDDNLRDNSGEFSVTVSIKVQKDPKGRKGGGGGR